MYKCFCGGQTDESVCLISPSTGKFLEPVVINVYDMHWTNDFTTTLGFGIFHTGIEIYGIEYAYAGHPYAFSGIFEMIPRDQDKLGEQYHFRQSIRIGYTAFRFDEIDELMCEFGRQFRGDRYHLIHNNCNHFTGTVAKRICGRSIPNWVNRLAAFGSYVPYIERILPRGWLRPVPPPANKSSSLPSRSQSQSNTNNTSSNDKKKC